MPPRQLSLNLQGYDERANTTRQRLISLLSNDLDFHDQSSGYGSHTFHSFPAKFPPQLPRLFINTLTKPGDLILDPMSGSGTTVLESFFASRRGLGFDIDPLALKISSAKVTPLDVKLLTQEGNTILLRAKLAVAQDHQALKTAFVKRWDNKTQEFVDYWFAPETQIELMALRNEIEKIADSQMRNFFEIAFSSIIITKSGGVSLALDLGHTRPHKAKILLSQTGETIHGEELTRDPSPRLKVHTKILRSAFDEFQKRIHSNMKGIIPRTNLGLRPSVILSDAQCLPIEKEAVDLIITSPPYASNAIDYMRAHKFSLVWLGHSIEDLGQKRNEYIGGESIVDQTLELLPEKSSSIVAEISNLDPKKGLVVHRYYSEMTRVLREMHRVLKHHKTAIVVVGSSIMRGIDTETHNCLAEIGQKIGFEVPGIGVRHLDRDRRMLPAGNHTDLSSQIQQRMHEEYVIGFYKP